MPLTKASSFFSLSLQSIGSPRLIESNISHAAIPYQDSINIQNRQRSPFLRLPAEIRIALYACSLGIYVIRVGTKTGAGENPIRVSQRTAPRKAGMQRPAHFHALSITFRHIRSEMGLDFHALSEFKLTDPRVGNESTNRSRSSQLSSVEQFSSLKSRSLGNIMSSRAGVVGCGHSKASRLPR